LAKARKEIKRLYKRFSQPIGKNKAKDKADLEKFLKFIDWITTLGWILIGIAGVLSFYFFITTELM